MPDVITELHYDGAWNDISTDVRHKPGHKIKWGLPGEAGNPVPASCKLTLDNRDGRYSSRKPASPLFGKIGRNTPIRVRIGPTDARMSVDADSDASTPDSAGLDVTGDFDARIGVKPDSWRPTGGSSVGLTAKYEIIGDQRSWGIVLTTAGAVRLLWSPDGTLANREAVTSTASIPESAGPTAIRITLDVDNGASGHDATFYLAPTVDGPWTQLGDVVTGSGVTSVHAGTADVHVGTAPGIVVGMSGAVFAFQLLDGIDGTVVASPDFTALDPETGPSFTDAQGNEWTMNGRAIMRDASVRFAGEVSKWPPEWSVGDVDVRTPITASGIRRRLGQGAKALRSAMYRGMTGDNITTPVGYWPMEDGRLATSFGSALDGHPAMSVTGEVNPAAFSGAVASEPIPTFTTGSTNATVPAYSGHDFLRAMVLASLPDPEISTTNRFMQVITRGTARRWLLFLHPGGGFQVRAFDRDGAVVVDSTAAFGFTAGWRGALWLYLTQNGADIDWQIGAMEEGSTSAGVVGDTLTGHTIGRCTGVRLGAGGGGNLENMAMGHLTALNTSEFWEIAPFVRAWSGETAVARITRLCAEEDVPLRLLAGDSRRVGPQAPAPFLTLVDEAAAADGPGILIDDRDSVRLLYRNGATLYNQTPALTLDYATGDVAPKLAPVEDDKNTRNDVTARRPEGSSARVTQMTGPLSVLPPPDGVGRYDATVPVNVADDAQLPNQASWRVHLGTVDEPRYPQITVDLLATPSLFDAATSVHAGDRIQITNPPSWLPPGIIDQLAIGGTETMDQVAHKIIYNCAPASPWDVAQVGKKKTDTDGSETAASFVSGTDTSLSVAITAGPLWTTDPAQLPFEIEVAGVVLNVTAISGTSSPQTFTVDATPVNGIEKTIPAGSPLRLAAKHRATIRP